MITVSLRVFVLVALTAAAAAAQGLAQAQEHFQQGRAYHTGEGRVEVDLEKALRHYLQAIKIHPTFYEAHVNTGKIYFARNDYRRAKYHLNEAIKQARGRPDIPPSEEARITSDLGSCFHKEGNLAAAEKWFRGAIHLDPGLVEGHYNLINLLLADERPEEARQQMRTAQQLAPSPRYGIFEGRLQTRETYAEWNPTWLKIAVAGVVVGAGLYTLLRRLRGKDKRRQRGARP